MGCLPNNNCKQNKATRLHFTLGFAEDTSPAEAGAWGWVRFGIAFRGKAGA